MSLHAQLSPEVQAKLTAQKKNSMMSSIIISLLLLLLVGIALTLFLLPKVENPPPDFTTYRGTKEKKEKMPRKKISRQVQPKSSSLMPSMAKVIAAELAANVAIPTVTLPTEIPIDFGSDDGVGGSWGDDQGWESGGDGATFFGEKVVANRVCYVIDYSASMKGRRIQLLKEELVKSIKAMSPEMKYQLIFFAGPAWLAGDQVIMNGRQDAIVKSNEGQYKWKSPNRNPSNWKVKGKKQPVSWLDASTEQVRRSVKAVQDTPLIWGTAWEHPLEMALNMDPAPQVIFFMTDGLAGNDSESIAKKISARAKAKGIQINTIAMMEPRASNAMKILSSANEGSFTLIEEDGTIVEK